MKLGLSTASFYSLGETEENAAHLLAFPELDTCEVFLETWSEYNAGFARQVRERLNGLQVTSVHPKGTQFEPDLFARSRRQVEDAYRILNGVLEAGEALGAGYYVMHGPGTVVNPRPPEVLPELAERVDRMQRLAAAHGMEILWENVSWCTLPTVETVKTMRRLLPDMHFVLDTKQAHRAGQNPFDMLEAMGPQLRHVHILDWCQDDTLCLPGEGCFDWPAFFARLKDMSYTGSVILEPYEYLAREDKRLRKSLRSLRQWI